MVTNSLNGGDLVTPLRRSRPPEIQTRRSPEMVHQEESMLMYI
jgi:hypothetical protein